MTANKKALQNRTIPRRVIKCTQEQLNVFNPILVRGVDNGQSLHHIYWSNLSIFQIIHEDTLRRYVYSRRLRIKPYQLPMFVRFKSKRGDAIDRENTTKELRNDGRSYYDFLQRIEIIQYAFWEYDSVEGIISDRYSILTITYAKINFQFGFKIKKHDPISVLNVIRNLQHIFGEDYWKIFKINLCDNGLEFKKFIDIEFDAETGEKKCSVYFTRPYKSSDKPECERNHEFIRKYLPKGESIDFMTQTKINLMFSHINSYIREELNNKTPYELFVMEFGTRIAKLIGIVEIDHNDVCLKPRLVK